MIKGTALLLLFMLLFTACGEDSREEVVDPLSVEVEKDSITTIEGDFIWLADNAVIKGQDFIYGVEPDSLSHILAEKVAPLKSDEFDMVPVVVKAKIIPNPSRKGWEEIVQIREIIDIPLQETDDTETPKVNRKIEKP